MAMFKTLIGLGIGLTMAGLATQAEAFSFSSTVTDTGNSAYWGGSGETGNSPYGDVIGDDPPFGVTSMTVHKNEADNTLYVDIITSYSGGNLGALTTQAGALFLGDPDNFALNGATQTNLLPAGDIYYDGPGGHADDINRFNHALDYTDANGNPVANPNSGAGGSTRLYALNGLATDVVTSHHPGTSRDFQAYDVFRAGDPTGAANGTFAGAVVNTSAGTAAGSTWSTVPGLFSFTIADFFNPLNPLTAAGGIYEFGATIAWTMLCGNDVILGAFAWNPGNAGEVPLPAGLILLFSGLFGLGFLGRLKAKKPATSAI